MSLIRPQRASSDDGESQKSLIILDNKDCDDESLIEKTDFRVNSPKRSVPKARATRAQDRCNRVRRCQEILHFLIRVAAVCPARSAKLMKKVRKLKVVRRLLYASQRVRASPGARQDVLCSAFSQSTTGIKVMPQFMSPPPPRVSAWLGAGLLASATRRRISIIAATVLGLMSGNACAALYTSSFGSLVPGYYQNDDFYFGSFGLNFSMDFFGTAYDSFYINNNGTLNFARPTGSYTPTALDVETIGPMIAPFWTDLDSRNAPNSNAGVYLNQSATQTVVTWYDMGFFSNNYSGRVTFQLVLNDDSSIPAGEADIGFFFDSMTSGTDRHSAASGFGDGLASINPGEISYASGLSSAVTAALNDSYVWFNLNGGIPEEAPEQVPAPATLALVGLGMVGILARRKRKPSRVGRSGTH